MLGHCSVIHSSVSSRLNLVGFSSIRRLFMCVCFFVFFSMVLIFKMPFTLCAKLTVQV